MDLLTEKEKYFIMTCINMANIEGFYLFDKSRNPKYDDLTKEEYIDLMNKIGIPEEEQLIDDIYGGD